ncbi:MAG TPA: glycosyltransferase family 4 protein [Egibacteraceae bacterium]|nr:glycosyltransferase family 4 protein [Egibacteraceae bacterium]
MTRTLWITNDFPPRAGGIEQFVHHLLERLPPDSVRVIASGWEGDAAHDATLPYPVTRLRRPLLPTPGVLAEARRAIRDHQPDVVVFGAAWPLGELAGRLGVPSLGFTHGHEAGLARVGFGPLIRRVARRVDALGVISGFTRRELQRWIGPYTAVHDLPPGVDVRRFHPEVDRAAARRAFQVPDEAPLVVCVGRLVPRKGQDVLVEAWPRVLRRHPDARLLLVGDGPLLGRLTLRVGQLGLEHRVRLAGGVDWHKLPLCHAAADLFAMPCRSRWGGLDVEGLGIVYLEAQACGVPVLAGRSGGAPEALVPGETGEVVDGTSPEAVAGAIARLLDDRAALRRMGAAGRAFVERRYAWDAIGARLRELLQEIGDKRPSR